MLALTTEFKINSDTDFGRNSERRFGFDSHGLYMSELGVRNDVLAGLRAQQYLLLCSTQ